ncbi:translocation/assembly module TamB domain-containing protein [Castellaniella sp.]|uniref:translocation/assembly module TamB domain-containing protein n=1 Tax=Castellaniella sp. TaxID=1955812 RepID=UPI002AFE6148|nr:translocation/assembly module TamB domain-containing protein [Castellaniella sp.]
MSWLSRLGRGLRRFSLWGLPPLVLALALVLGFAWWCVASTAGTRWLLQTAVAQFDGQVQGVNGTIRRGLYVQGLSLSLPDADVRVTGLHLKVLWHELLNRRLHINDLSAVRADIIVRPGAASDAAPAESFSMPPLPVSLRVDRLSLGGLGLHGAAQLPVDVLSVSTALTLDADTAAVTLDQLQMTYDNTLLTLNGNVALRGLAAPWPFEVNLHGTALGRGAQSPVCLSQQWPATDRQAIRPAASQACRIDLDVRLAGTPDVFQLQAQGQGEGMSLQADARILPAQAFPLGQTTLDLTLPDQAGLSLQIQPGAPGPDGLRPLQASWAMRHLSLNPWLPPTIGATLLDFQGQIQARLTPTHQLQDLGLQLDINTPSRWNGHPLAGHVRLAHLSRAQGPLLDGQDPLTDLFGIRAQDLQVALDMGANQIRLDGQLSVDKTALALQATLPALDVLWPDIPGGGRVTLDLQGALAKQQIKLQARYVPADEQLTEPGQAPIDLDLALLGGWSAEHGWQGAVTRLQGRHAGVQLDTQGNVPLQFDAAGGWQVGRGLVDLQLDGQALLQVQHRASSGQTGHWETQGRIDPLLITPERIQRIQAWLGQKAEQRQGGVQTALSAQARDSRLTLALDWHVLRNPALSGNIRLQRLDGDLVVPGDVPIELGLKAAQLDLTLKPGSDTLSRALLDLQVGTQKMGSLRIQAESPVHVSPDGTLGLRAQDEKRVHLVAESEDLAWVNLLLGGALEVGGTVHADVQGRSRPDGQWLLTGPVRGEGMRFMMVDEGVRLLDGTLQAHFEGMNLVLDHLRFPAVRRVTPKEWRTATWVAENPDAQDGYLDLGGQWDLGANDGLVNIEFHRYPILQRADRYAMISGDLRISAALPRVDLTGKIVADAGWFDLDMLNNIPSLDSDVVVLKPGQKQVETDASPPLNMEVALTVDLGPRFYLTGYGLDSGLVGSLDLRLHDDKLTALGALRTRGGAIDAYGQHLQLRRGTITFQGDISNPTLDIQALRTNVAVQAGVQVVGTARRPRIDLISVPEVSETEKLTWLLLGHGPDEGGADMSLLFSVGSSFLADGEPFYRRFGLDELSLRSGELGSTGSILPVQSVVSGLDSGVSPIEQRFVMASKTLSQDLKVSLEQALSQTGTVARLSYRLMRGLRAEMTVGTVSGLALVYRWFSMD